MGAIIAGDEYSSIWEIDSDSGTGYNVHMTEDKVDFTIEGLADTVGVSARTVRYYIAEGLVPGPGGRGKAASYTQEHLLRLRLIRRLAEQRVPIKEIRERLSGLSVAEISTILAEDDRRTAQLQGAIESMSPQEYVSELLRRANRYGSGSSVRQAAVPSTPPAGAVGGAAVPAAPSSLTGDEAWERWVLAPGVELHVRADARDENRRLIGRVLRAAGRLA